MTTKELGQPPHRQRSCVKELTLTEPMGKKERERKQRITTVDRGSVPRQFPILRGWTNDEIKSRAGQGFEIEFGRGYLEDTLDFIIVINEEEEVSEEEYHNKSVEPKAKVKNQTRVSKVKFTPPNFSLGVSQEATEALPKGVVLVDSEPDVLITEAQVLNCDMEDVLTRGRIMVCSREEN
ncbi:hypothetical protein Cgig2_024219 [Carnegiea gigantea]|uniref:Uncharacterized protein n=1 Tax=Carnegiea gigantea TaxID=171969 RepID=A0A9Q1JFG8_9CARY|nr:hypothetical protein Cgig2_024219 [Carnegiea gigantea]